MPEIRVDSSSLTYPQFVILGHGSEVINGAAAPTVSLEPGVYGIEQVPGRPASFQFEVSQDGTVEFDAAFDGFLEGRGTTTLVLRGFAATIDGRALSHDLNPFITGGMATLSRDSAHDLQLLPAPSYMFLLARGMADFGFAVAADGRIVVDPVYAGFTEVVGRSVVIHGFKVTIDARELSHDLSPELLNWSAGPLPRAEAHELTLIPSQQYLFFLARGMADFQFAVAVDGRIVVDPSFAGFADATGRTLTIHGYKVTIDARELSHDLNPELLNWSTGPLPRAEAHELTLIPSQQYLFFLARGMADFQFAVAVDGRIVVDPSFAGFADATGRTLTIHGYKVTIDARELSHDLNPELLNWSAGPLSRTEAH
ncbi:hypothetical protein J5Y04_37220, partial [Kitasatospora sp. RG8]|nr:hypothetical protein [Kitasatospora sp. RG8]